MVTVKSLGFWLACGVVAIATPSVSHPLAVTGKISGTVVDGVTGKPLADATVKLVLYQDRMCEPCVEMANPPPNVLTASDGKFEFDGIRPDAFQVKVSKPTYGVGGFGVTGPTGYPGRIDVAEGAEVSGLTVALYRLAVIKGHVTDQRGQPVADQLVSFMTRESAVDRLEQLPRELIADRVWLPNPEPYTDDQGNYVAELPAGSYFALVNFVGSRNVPMASVGTVKTRNTGYVSTFFPGVRSIDGASPLVLKPGEIREGLDFHLARAPIVGISGRVEAPADTSPADVLSVRLLNDRFPGSYEAAVRADRSFAFAGVPSGDYLLSVRLLENFATAVVARRNQRVTSESLTPLKVPATDVNNLVVRTVSAQVASDGRVPNAPARNSGANISGSSAVRVVLVDDRGTPVELVTVDLTRFLVPIATGTTDQRGVVEFRDVPAGTFMLSARRAGYRWATYGRKMTFSDGVAVELSAGESRTIRFQIERAGVIAGTIRDERGKPVSEAVVTARLWTSNAGQRVLGDAKGVLTDNAGRFRLHGLSGGTYIVTAQQSSLWSDEGVRRLDEPGDGLSRVDLYASIPRVVTPDSNGGVSVRTGQQRDGIDLVVERRVRRMTTVEGTFVLPSFGPLTQPPRIVQYDDPLEIEQADYAHRGAAMDEAGRFVFRNVRPGKHRVYAQYGSMWAITDIETDGRAISSLVLAPKAGSGVTGRVVVDSISPPSDLRQFEMHLETQLPLNFGAFESFGFSMGENGRFGFKGVPPGRYAIDYYRKSGADPWRVVSVVVNGVEALDFPFEVIEDKDVSDVVVTVSDRHTRLAGVARNANGEPTSETVVVAFPPDSRYWLPDARRVMLALPDSKGRFAFADLPAGDYLIAAIANPPTDGDWDSQLLARLKPIGVSVNLAAGESKMVDVRVR